MMISLNKVAERVQQAKIWYSTTPGATFRTAGAKFTVAALSVSDAYNSRALRANTLHSNARLSTQQEKVLCQHILALQQQLRAMHYPEVRVVADLLARENCDSESEFQPLGANWLTNFIKRHPELRSKKEQYLEIERVLTSYLELLRA